MATPGPDEEPRESFAKGARAEATAVEAALGGRLLRPLAIAFAILNALAAATAVFGAAIYVSEADDRQLQRDTFEALAVEMLFARLDRSRRTYSDSSDVLKRLNAFGVRVRDLDLSHLVFLEAPAAPNSTVFLRGDQYFIACPVGDDSYLGVDGAGRVSGCQTRQLTLDVRNPVQVEMLRSSLTEPTIYCRAGASLRLVDVALERPTFQCKPDQVVFVGQNSAAEDPRWCHPDDAPAQNRPDGPPIYASGPCAGEPYPFFLGQNVETGLPGTR